MERTFPHVWIVIVNWNGRDDTLAAVRSCLALTYPAFTIAVVDNGSTNDSVPVLREAFAAEERVVLLETGRNLGFAGGNNVAIREALARTAEYVWLLNNDTEVDPGALTSLVDALEADPRAGMAGSKIYYHSRPNVIWYAGGELDPRDGHSMHVGEGLTDQGQFDTPGETGYITGCSLLVRREVIETIGEMPEQYFVYWEEVDWNASAHEAGYKTLYVPGSRVWHKVSASISARRGLQLRYEMRNRLLFYARHQRGRVPALLVWGKLRVLRTIARRDWEATAGISRGIVDFVAGRRGEIVS